MENKEAIAYFTSKLLRAVSTVETYLLILLISLIPLLYFLAVNCADLISTGQQDSPRDAPKPKPRTKSKTRTAMKRKAPSKVSLKMTPAKMPKKVIKSRNLRTKTKPPSSKTAPTKGKVSASNRSPFGKVKSSKPPAAEKQQHHQANLVHKTGDSALKFSHSSSFGSYARVEPRKTEEYSSEMSSSIPDPDED